MVHRFTRTTLSLLLVLSLFAAAAPAPTPVSAATADLFISEYIEGSSNNKAIEIYNGTGAAIDLAAGVYNVFMSFNGGTSTLLINLTGTVADGDVYVVAQASADPLILAQADQTNGAGWFNGDDAVLLRQGTTVVDALGQVGFDPGSEWGAGLTSTADNTLRRQSSICAGDTDAANVFDPAVEWTGFATNTFDGLGSHTADCGEVGTATLVINELDYDQPSTDTAEYVEILNTGTAAANLAEYTLELVNGSTGAVVYDTIALPAVSLAPGDYFVVCANAGTVANCDLDDAPDTNFIQNGAPDAVGLRHLGVLVDAVSYEGSTGAPYTEGSGAGLEDIGVDGSLGRCADGVDTNQNNADFEFVSTSTPGAANACPPPPPPFGCTDPTPITLISAIQGSGAASPLAGSLVDLQAVVVADFQGAGQIGGYYVQEEDADADGDAATSEGLYIFDNANVASAGDLVRLRGTVAETFGQTELNTLTGFAVCGTAATASPAVLSLPVASLDAFEAVEGMAVTFPQALVISEYFNYDRFGELVLTSVRRLTPSAEFEPGPAAIAAAQAFDLDSITLDDGRGSQNPDPALHPNGAVFDLSNLFRGGDTVSNVTGVMGYGFNAYRIQPTQGAGYTAANPRPAAPDAVGGSVTVASFNVLNYFTTLDNAGFICGPAGTQECRGADNAEEFARQRAKIIAALVAIDADVVGLLEIENHPADGPAADLVSGLNDVLGAGTYAYLATGAVGTDAIRVAIIYKPATVTPVGAYAVLDSSVDPRFVDTKSRPAIAQTFQDNATGGVFTVAVNHLKSKGSDCNDVGDLDLGDGAGNCNLTRLAAAQALVDWLAGDPTGSGDADFLIMGDLNSYDKEDPIDAIRAGADDTAGTGDDYADLVFNYLGEAAYSYVFDGQIGYLDHALAVGALVPQVSGVTIWHINADEPDLLDYDTTFKQAAQDALYAPDPYRSSDHDPVIVGLNTCDQVAPTLTASVTPAALWPPNHKYVNVTATVAAADNFDLNPTITLLSVTSNEPDNGPDDGNTVNDIVVVDSLHVKLRAERSDSGTGRIYTLTYQVTDACGNSAVQSVTVTVPLNN